MALYDMEYRIREKGDVEFDYDCEKGWNKYSEVITLSGMEEFARASKHWMEWLYDNEHIITFVDVKFTLKREVI